MRAILKNIILTVQYIGAKYRVHREITAGGDVQEYVSTDQGAGFCVSIAGLDTNQLLDKSLVSEFNTIQVCFLFLLHKGEF